MIRILLIRHASTDLLGDVLCGRTPGISLNEKGFEEAKVLGRRLEDDAFSAIVSSPLERAVQTANVIAESHRAEVCTDNGFNELDFGTWTGRRFAELHNDDDWH